MKSSRQLVDDFLAERTMALAGASRSGRKFGNTVFRELRSKGYEVIPVHPEAAAIDGVPCVRSLGELGAGVGALVTVTPPAATEALVREAAEAGLRRVWMQQGSESDAAIDACRESGIAVVAGECILMFAEPAAWIHRFHRWLRSLRGGLPG